MKAEDRYPPGIMEAAREVYESLWTNCFGADCDDREKLEDVVAIAGAIFRERKRCADYLLSCGDHGDAAKADAIMRGEP